MVASGSSNTNPARIPALGIRALVFIALSLLLMVLDHRQHYLDLVRQTLGAVVYPIQVVVDSPFRLWDWIGESSRSRQELQLELSRLQAERLITNARLQKLTALEAENARLRDLLEARSQVRDEIRVTEIMAVDANPFRHSIIIDVGQRDAVYDGQAIVDAAGVVGQVIQTGLTTSQALLISDPSHALPVEVNRNGLRTIAKGTGELDRLDLPFLPNNADIEVGDLLVTSGLGGMFPAGYPVAVVTTVNRIPQEPFADVSATPAASLDQVREVMLIWPSPGGDSAGAGNE
ncbi:MAG TPA: rod shape-determining protein MreC [Woeseiaceae bacterium]|jgi:rod shape-determining protein MreC|nr:rod shape-determining protein MreC [Woeseiaceae bacterium]